MAESMEGQAEFMAPQSRWRWLLFNDGRLRVPWRLLMFLTTAFIIMGALKRVMHFIIGALHLHPPTGPEMSPQPIFVQELPVVVMLLLASFVMSRVERRSFGDYGLRWNPKSIAQYMEGFLYGVFGCGLVLVAMRAFGVFSFGSLALHGAEALRWAATWFAAYLVVGVMEEYQFRGYVFTTLQEGITFWPAALLLSGWFAFAHLGNPGETKIGIFSVFAFGILFCWMVRVTGSLWLAIGFHQSWDFAQSFLFGVPDSGIIDRGRLLTPIFHGNALLTGGSVGPEGSLITFAFGALLAVVLTLRFRRRETQPVLSSPLAAVES